MQQPTAVAAVVKILLQTLRSNQISANVFIGVRCVLYV